METGDEERRAELTAEQVKKLRGIIDDFGALATRVESLAVELPEEGQARAQLDCVDFDHLRPALSGLLALLSEVTGDGS